MQKKIKSVSSIVTAVMADNPFSIELLMIRPVGERGFATPTAGAAVPTLESVILHYLR